MISVPLGGRLVNEFLKTVSKIKVLCTKAKTSVPLSFLCAFSRNSSSTAGSPLKARKDDKLKIILSIPNAVINKSILTLIDKKYIFIF